jgi:hypothetical protein
MLSAKPEGSEANLRYLKADIAVRPVVIDRERSLGPS